MQKNNFRNLEFNIHIPLIDIINDIELLDENQLQYVNNDWTYIEFAIFNKKDKRLVMAIEAEYIEISY